MDSENMKVHSPDGWTVLKITDTDEVFYKIFGSWHGSQTEPDYWRLSGGSSSSLLQDMGDHYLWKQESGSTYKLDKQTEGQLTFHNKGVLKGILKQFEEEGVVCEVMVLKN
jgi:hypothetical protein